jgi:hypothetical protein
MGPAAQARDARLGVQASDRCLSSESRDTSKTFVPLSSEL